MTPSGAKILRRVEMWCARNWVEAKSSAAIAAERCDVYDHLRFRQDEREWLDALLVVNRIALGIEPLSGIKLW